MSVGRVVGFCRACQCDVHDWRRHMVSKKHRRNARRLRFLEYQRKEYLGKKLGQCLEQEKYGKNE